MMRTLAVTEEDVDLRINYSKTEYLSKEDLNIDG